MPYRKPLKENGTSERPYAHAVKLCYFLVKFQRVNNPYDLKYFCTHFDEIVETYHLLEILEDEFGITWTYFNDDGSICKPKYETACKRWKPNNKWEEQYPIFKSDRLMSSDQTELEKYIRQKAYFNRKDSELMGTCYDKENDYKAAEDKGKDMTYYRNKNNETISTTEERWRKRLGLDKEDTNKEIETIPVPTSPEHEDQHIRDIWTERAKQDVIPR